MVGPLQPPAPPTDVAISLPVNDAGHAAHNIKTATTPINGISTTFIAQPFADRIFITVTQLDKMGTILAAERETAFGGASAFSVSVLVGKREVPELQLCARQIVESMVADGCEKPLLLSVALRDHSMGTVKAVIDYIKNVRVW